MMNARNNAAALGLNFHRDPNGAGNGLRISGLNTDSAAQQAGLQAGDQIVAVNGTRINSLGEMQALLQTAATANGPLSLYVQRNGQLKQIGIPLSSSLNQAAATGATGFRGFSDGVSFAAAATTNGTSGAVADDGLRVSNVTPNSWAAAAGLSLDDRIMSVNGQSVTSDLQLAARLQSAVDQNGFAELTVNRNGVMTPLRVNNPLGTAAMGGAANAAARLTGNFSTDFGSWATDFSSSIERSQQASQKRFDQLQQFNDRITSLRGMIGSSTGQSADNVRLMEQLRSLRTDLALFQSQQNQATEAQLQELLSRLNQLEPTGQPATGNGLNPAPLPSAAPR
jgi:membrane-associated protease RseP (regulator of RpoE activity)